MVSADLADGTDRTLSEILPFNRTTAFLRTIVVVAGGGGVVTGGVVVTGGGAVVLVGSGGITPDCAIFTALAAFTLP